MEKFTPEIMKLNGWIETTVPDFKVGDVVLLPTQEDNDQGKQITSIFDNGMGAIMCCHIPEKTLVKSFSLFTYGYPVRKKYLVV